MRHHANRNLIANAALAVAALALFVALGGPAYAAKAVKQISGSTIKAKSITSKQLADGSVSLPKVAKSAQATLKAARGPAGAKGATGPVGATGDRGATGRSGGYDVYDAKGRRVGTYEGTISGYILVGNDENAIFLYDNNSATSYALAVTTPVLLFKATGCEGQPYLAVNPTYPSNWATVTSVPATAGDTPYIPQQGAAPEAFTAQSTLTSSGCADTATPITDAVPAAEAGSVPTAKKPLSIRLR